LSLSEYVCCLVYSILKKQIEEKIGGINMFDSNLIVNYLCTVLLLLAPLFFTLWLKAKKTAKIAEITLHEYKFNENIKIKDNIIDQQKELINSLVLSHPGRKYDV